MNKKIISWILFVIVCSPALGAFDWWNLDDEFVCQIDNTPCYFGVTQGVDDEWDVTGSCRGRKYVCGDALKENTSSSAIAVNKTEINNSVSSDFDVTVYVAGENCYGTRKTTDNGRMASVNGRYVKVWCNGVLNSPTDTLSNGEFTTGAEPTCKQLANDGFAGIANGKPTKEGVILLDGLKLLDSSKLTVSGSPYAKTILNKLVALGQGKVLNRSDLVTEENGSE